MMQRALTVCWVALVAQTLIDAGVKESKITFLNVISCPEGIDALFRAYPGTSRSVSGGTGLVGSLC